MRRFMGLPALLVVAVLALGDTAQAGDFRILNRVYVGEEKEPTARTTTIFRAGRVYDIILDPEEAVVFDPTSARFVLLDPGRTVRAEISVEQIENIESRLKERLDQRKGAATAFLLDPRFEREVVDGGEASFTSEGLSYHLNTKPAPSTDVAREYAAFTHWYTRLNLIKNPQLLARLPINTWLNDNRRIPTEVKLIKTKFELFGLRRKEETVRSEHVLTTALSREDERKLRHVARWLAEFRRVPLGEYWQAPIQARRASE